MRVVSLHLVPGEPCAVFVEVTHEGPDTERRCPVILPCLDQGRIAGISEGRCPCEGYDLNRAGLCPGCFCTWTVRSVDDPEAAPSWRPGR